MKNLIYLAALISLAATAQVPRLPGSPGNTACQSLMGSYSAGCNQSFSTGLLGWWRLNESSGTTAFDSTGYTNNGTDTGATPGAAGCVQSKATSYSGSAQNTEIPASAVYALTYFTVTAWVKSTTANAGIVLMDIGSGNRVFQLDAGATAPYVIVFLGGTPQTVSGTKAINDGKCHLVAATYNGNHVCVWVDGAQDTCTALTGAMTTATSTVIDIAGRSGVTSLWNGTIEDVRLYNVPLSASDMASLYASGN